MRIYFSKSFQIRRKVLTWSHLPKKYLMANFIFSAVAMKLKLATAWWHWTKKYLKNKNGLTLSCIMLTSGQNYYKNLAMFTLQDFQRTFHHFSSLFMEELRKGIILRISQDKRYFEFWRQVFIKKQPFAHVLQNRCS